MSKRIICLIVSIFMLISLFTGCGSAAADKKAETASEPTKQETKAEEKKAEEPKKEEPKKEEQKEVTLKYITWMTKGEDKPMMEAFMKANPKIKVVDEALDGIQYDKLLKTRILSGDVPDVFLIQWPQYSKYVKEGYLMDITNEPGMELQKKSPAVDSLYDVGGKKYGFMISANGGPIPVYYNKKYFAKLNLTPPKTMDEFFKVCDAIKADGKDPLVFGNKDRWPLEFFFRHRGYSGMLEKYPDWGYAMHKGDIKPSEYFKKELELTELLVKKGYIGKASLTLTWPQSVPYFVDGKAGMLPQGPWVPSLPEIKNADPAKFELGCFTSPMEAIDGKKYTTGEADRTIVVSASTKNPNEAKKLFNFFVAPENLKTYLETNTITTFINFDYKVDPVLQEHVKGLSSSDYKIILKQKANITPAFADATMNSYQNIEAGSTAEKELKKLDVEFEKTKAQMVVNE